MPRLEQVEWLDSRFLISGWYEEQELDGRREEPIVSVGFLVRETKDLLMLALCWNPAPDGKPWAQLQTIPKCAVLSRRQLRFRRNHGGR